MLSLKIAIRYLFAKKSHNAINGITLVASCGIAVITTAMICMLSVFNGFEALVGSLCSNFDAELRVEAKVGKTFEDSDSLRTFFLQNADVSHLSAVLEDNFLLSYSGRQIPAKMMGVDESFAEVTSIDSIIIAGEFVLQDEVADYCALGGGLASQLGAGSSFVRPLSAFCPKRKGKIDLLKPEDAFTDAYIYCSSIFLVNQADYDDNICITSLNFARRMLQDSLAVTAYELKLREGADAEEVKQTLLKTLQEDSALSSDFVIKTRYEQQATSFRIMQIEKWITFLIVVFILIIASFNLVGSLSMLIIDKEAEIRTLRNLGATESLVRSVFRWEGLLISGVGAAFGIVLGVSLCLVQEEFGIIGLGGNGSSYIIDSYPVVLRWSDVLCSTFCVAVIGLIASCKVAMQIKK